MCAYMCACIHFLKGDKHSEGQFAYPGPWLDDGVLKSSYSITAHLSHPGCATFVTVALAIEYKVHL